MIGAPERKRREAGYAPGGIIGTLLVIVLILVVFGHA